MNANRRPNGQFGSNNNANPGGRRHKEQSMLDEVARELNSKITITQNGKRKRVSKLAANTMQIANQGASGELKAAKMAVEFALKTNQAREPEPAAPPLTPDDEAIVARFIARIKATDLTSDDPAGDASSAASPTNPTDSPKSDLENPDADGHL